MYIIIPTSIYVLYFRDVLPVLTGIMGKLSKESYLKDKGSSYRYTQSYKLQLTVLQNLANVLTYLDMSDTYIESTIDCVFPYLDSKQPLPLQVILYIFSSTQYTLICKLKAKVLK